MWGPGGPPPAASSSELSTFAIEKLTAAIEHKPKEFVFQLMLIDHLRRDGQLARAVEVARTACEVAPKDPRATYALATVLWSVTRAKYSAPEFGERVEKAVLFFARIDESFDPEASQQALAELGMTLEESVNAAALAFKQTLQRGVRRGERHLVTDSLDTLRDEFSEYLR